MINENEVNGDDLPIACDDGSATEEEKTEDIFPVILPKEFDVVFEVPKDTRRAPVKPKPISESLSLPYFQREDTLAFFSSLHGDQVPTEDLEWLTSTVASVDFLEFDNYFTKALHTKDAEWTNVLFHDKMPVAPLKPKLRKGGEGRGSSAVIKARQAAGLGSHLSFPLIHSGFWITIKAPSDDDWLFLDAKIANSKISLGRETGGAALTHASIYAQGIIIDFMKSFITLTNLANTTTEEAIEMIDYRDYPAILLHFKIAAHPNGYDYAQPCIANVNKCTHVTRGIISLSKLWWVNKTGLNGFHKSQIAKRTSQTTVSACERYRNELHVAVGKLSTYVYQADEFSSITFNIKAPLIKRACEVGDQWISGLVSSIDDSLNLKPDERNQFLSKRAGIQNLCKHSAWVESIEVNEHDEEEGLVTQKITDVETLHETLANLSENDELADGLRAAIDAYKAASTHVVIGIPNYACPSCGDDQLGEGTPIGIIPINVETVFTTLIRQRMVRKAIL